MGKTIQMIALMVTDYGEKPNLVVACVHCVFLLVRYSYIALQAYCRYYAMAK